jgi:hypothetical protein
MAAKHGERDGYRAMHQASRILMEQKEAEVRTALR